MCTISHSESYQEPLIFYVFDLKPSAPETVIEILSRDNRFSTLVSLVSAVGLLPALEEETILTVFAPTDQAFEALDLPSDTPPEIISQVLLNHVVRGAVPIENWPSHGS